MSEKCQAHYPGTKVHFANLRLRTELESSHLEEIQSEKLRMRESNTNPSKSKRIESFEIFGLTNRIHDTNLSEKSSMN